jgi:hypothetical protein
MVQKNAGPVQLMDGYWGVLIHVAPAKTQVELSAFEPFCHMCIDQTHGTPNVGWFGATKIDSKQKLWL